MSQQRKRNDCKGPAAKDRKYCERHLEKRRLANVKHYAKTGEPLNCARCNVAIKGTGKANKNLCKTCSSFISRAKSRAVDNSPLARSFPLRTCDDFDCLAEFDEMNY